jgi:hypothetical protein
MKLYLLNALITPFDTERSDSAFFVVKKISKDEYEDIFKSAIKQNFEIVSVIGHQSTVEFLKSILSQELRSYIHYRRTEINLEEGDLALIVRVKVRGKSIKEHSVEDLHKYYDADELEFLTLSRIYKPELLLQPDLIGEV